MKLDITESQLELLKVGYWLKFADEEYFFFPLLVRKNNNEEYETISLKEIPKKRREMVESHINFEQILKELQ